MSRFTFKTLDSNKSTVTEYTAHKSWEITDENASDYGVLAFSCSYSSGSFNIGDPADLSAAAEPKQHGYHNRLVFDSINHLYYSDTRNHQKSGDNQFLAQQHRELLTDVQVLSIPSNIYGDRILPGSVNIETQHLSSNNYQDDGKGNLFVEFQDKEQYELLAPPEPKDTFIYLTFDSERTYSVGSMFPNNYYFTSYGENISYTPVGNNVSSVLGRRTRTQLYNYNYTFRAVSLTGTASFEEGSESKIEIENTLGLKDWNSDFAILCYVKLPTSQSVSSSFSGPLIGKLDQRRTIESHTENIIATSRGFTDKEEDNFIIPWEISVVNDGIGTDDVGKIYAKRGIYSDVVVLSSSVSHNVTGSEDVYAHILFQKTGSELQLAVTSGSNIDISGFTTWTGGAMFQSSTSTEPDPLNNIDVTSRTNICLGAQRAGFKQRIKTVSSEREINPAYIKPLSGVIDEFVIYKKAFTIPGGSTLAANVYPLHWMNTIGSTNPIAGNIFYNHGIICLTDGNKQGGQLDLENYTLTFSGSHDLTAHNYKCVVENGEYNMTLNPTARKGYDITNPNPQGFTTSSDFTPYITTIGLYNDRNELLAIGKLAQPVRSPKDFDITFQVKFDT